MAAVKHKRGKSPKQTDNEIGLDLVAKDEDGDSSASTHLDPELKQDGIPGIATDSEACTMNSVGQKEKSLDSASLGIQDTTMLGDNNTNSPSQAANNPNLESIGATLQTNSPPKPEGSSPSKKESYDEDKKNGTKNDALTEAETARAPTNNAQNDQNLTETAKTLNNGKNPTTTTIDLDTMEQDESPRLSVAGNDQRIQQIERERDQIQASYNALLNKLSSMKSFFSKMKDMERELEETRLNMEALAREKAEAEAKALAEAQTSKQTVTLLRSQVTELNAECDRLSQLLTSTRRDLLLQAELLQDEKYALENKCSTLSKKLAEQRASQEAYDVSRNEHKAESTQLRKQVEELRLQNESLQAQVLESREKVKLLSQTLLAQHDEAAQLQASHAAETEELRALAETARDSENTLRQALEAKQKELDAAVAQIKSEHERSEAVRSELTQKQLAIGQLRHELVTVNEHLTKALTMLKKQGHDRKVIDRQLISNVFILFLQLPRGDAKKFQALELIGALLEWDESQKGAAGLTHAGPGQTKGSSSDLVRRQSFVSLWTEYLERESSADQ